MRPANSKTTPKEEKAPGARLGADGNALTPEEERVETFMDTVAGPLPARFQKEEPEALLNRLFEVVAQRKEQLAAIPKPTVADRLRAAYRTAVPIAASAVRLTRNLIYTSAVVIADAAKPWRPQPTVELHDWPVVFGPVSGRKGDVRALTVRPECFFRCERFIATDTSKGHGTRVSCPLIGAKLQAPAGPGILTAFLGPEVHGNTWRWDACERAGAISITIEFLEDCDWEGTAFGTAVL